MKLELVARYEAAESGQISCLLHHRFVMMV